MLDCRICREPFDREKFLPKVIHCGHRICQVCLGRILKKNAICPFDNTPLKERVVENYPTNHAILEAPQQGTSSHDGLEIQKMRYLNEKRKKQSQKSEKKKKMALQLLEKFQGNIEKMHKEASKTLSRTEDVHGWTLKGLEVTSKKLKVQACYQEEENNIHQEFVKGSPPQFDLRIDDTLMSLANELKTFEENYKMALQNLVFKTSNLLREKMETISHLIQIIQKEDFIGIMPKEFGTGSTDILREIEVWKKAKKVVIFFKKDRINEDVLQAMAAVFEEFVNVNDVKLDLRNQNIGDAELSLLFERQFWQKPSVCKFSLDMENSKASSTALTTVLSKITTDMPQLISLNLWMRGTGISDEGLEALGKSTLGSLFYLEHFGLDISECKVLSDTGFYIGIPLMIQPLKNLSSLLFILEKNLQLSNEMLAFLFTNLFGSVTKLETLHLSLAGTELNDDSLRQISDALKDGLQNARNLSLLLNKTKITDLGAQYFIKTVLPNLPNAQTLALQLHKTEIGDLTMAAFLDTITKFGKDLMGVILNLTNTGVSDTGMSQYNCKNFCSMRRIELFQFATHGSLRSLTALSGFKSRVQEHVENSNKFQIL